MREALDPDATLDFFVVVVGGGGGASSTSGPGSTKTAILGALLPEAVLFDLPTCRKVVPAALLTSGTFSLTRALRVPSSGQGAAVASGLSEPEGSTNICMRPFDLGAVLVDVDGVREASSCGGREEAEREMEPEVRVREEDSPSTARRGAVVEAVGVGFAGAAAAAAVKPAIIRFWNSRCFVSRRSSG